MSSTFCRRVCSFLAAFSFAVLPATGQPLAAAAAAPGTLFAITGINQNFLSRLGPATGVVSQIEDLAGPNQGQLVTLTGDPSTHRLFTIR